MKSEKEVQLHKLERKENKLLAIQNANSNMARCFQINKNFHRKDKTDAVKKTLNSFNSFEKN